MGAKVSDNLAAERRKDNYMYQNNRQHPPQSVEFLVGWVACGQQEVQRGILRAVLVLLLLQLQRLGKQVPKTEIYLALAKLNGQNTRWKFR